MIKDYLKLAVMNLLHRKMRSWLTMIGIFIGIAAVVAIISLGQGLQATIDEQFNALGADKILVQPGASALGGATSVKLTEADREVLARTPGVERTVGVAYKSARIEFKNDQAFGLVMGVTLKDDNMLWHDVQADSVVVGRDLTKTDTFKTYLGYDFSQDKKVFPRAVQLHDHITINGQQFEVVGFQKDMGNANDNQAIQISDEAYARVFGQRIQDNYMMIMVQTSPGDNPSQVADVLKHNLRKHRGLKEGDEDFTLQTTEQLQESFNSILLIVQVVIVGIAAISLLIGGIGVMNTMYTAVLERTNEIGIMKAIGARNSDVLLIFLIESGMLGLVGGAIGVSLGLAVARLVELGGTLALGTPYLRAWWSWGLIGGALAFSFVVGAISGLAPAWQASRQKPVDSLRYE
jgi:putative ABC transport system permease protein